MPSSTNTPRIRGGETFICIFDFDDTVLTGDSDCNILVKLESEHPRMTEFYVDNKFNVRELFKILKMQWTNFVSNLISIYPKEEIAKVIPEALLCDDKMVDLFCYLQARRADGGLKGCVMQNEATLVEEELKATGQFKTVEGHPYVDVLMASDANVFNIEHFFINRLGIKTPSYSFSNPFYDMREEIRKSYSPKVLSDEEIHSLLPRDGEGRKIYSMIEWIFNPDLNTEASVKIPFVDDGEPLDYVTECNRLVHNGRFGVPFEGNQKGEETKTDNQEKNSKGNKSIYDVIRELTRSTINNCFNCAQATPNICKSQIVEDAIVFYVALLAAIRSPNAKPLLDISVIYCGDGNNDFCPISNVLRLRDYACVRKKFVLEKRIITSEINVRSVIKNIVSDDNNFLQHDVHINSIFHKRSNIEEGSSFKYPGVSNIAFWYTADELYRLFRNIVDSPLNYEKDSRNWPQNNVIAEKGIIQHKRLPPFALFDDENAVKEEFRIVTLDKRMPEAMERLIASLKKRNENRDLEDKEQLPPLEERFDIIQVKNTYSTRHDLSEVISVLEEFKKTFSVCDYDDKSNKYHQSVSSACLMRLNDFASKYLYYPLLMLCYGINWNELPWLQGEIFLHNLLWQIIHGSHCNAIPRPVMLYNKRYSPSVFSESHNINATMPLHHYRGTVYYEWPSRNNLTPEPYQYAHLSSPLAVQGDVNSIRQLHRRNCFRITGPQSDAFPPSTVYRTGFFNEKFELFDDNDVVSTVHGGCFDLYQNEKDDMTRNFFESRIIPMVLQVADFIEQLTAIYEDHDGNGEIGNEEKHDTKTTETKGVLVKGLGTHKSEMKHDTLLRGTIKTELCRLLSASVWGNAFDLSMFTTEHFAAAESSKKEESVTALAVAQNEKLIVNDIEKVTDYLANHVLKVNIPKRTNLSQSGISGNSSVGAVDIIMDNAGVECAADMLLTLVLLIIADKQAARQGIDLSRDIAPLIVRLHVKCISFYVSDVMCKDIHQMVNYWYYYDAHKTGGRGLSMGDVHVGDDFDKINKKIRMVAELFNNYFGGNLVEKQSIENKKGDQNGLSVAGDKSCSATPFSSHRIQVYQHPFFVAPFEFSEMPAQVVDRFFFKKLFLPACMLSVVNYDYNTNSQRSSSFLSRTAVSTETLPSVDDLLGPIYLDGAPAVNCRSKIFVNRSQIVGYHVNTNILSPPSTIPTHNIAPASPLTTAEHAIEEMLVAEVIVPMTDLVIVKGDLNYRRLMGDRHWTPDMFFKNTLHEKYVESAHYMQGNVEECARGEAGVLFNEEITMAQVLSHYWPFASIDKKDGCDDIELYNIDCNINNDSCNYNNDKINSEEPHCANDTQRLTVTPVPILALRTIKSELLVGVPTATLDRLDNESITNAKSDKEKYKWRVDGSHALAQFAGMQ